jgi:tetratricopeptide (TPR) repeat protein
LRASGKALLIGVSLSALCFGSWAAVPDNASLAFQQRHWSLTINLLEPLRSDPEAQRMLALAYFHVQDFDRALPALQRALAATPGDVELNVALLEVLLANRDYAGADRPVSRLDALGASDEAAFGRARVRLAEGDQESALEILQGLVEGADPRLATRAADIMIDSLYEVHRYGLAYEMAQLALQRDPDSPQAYRFSRIQPDPVTGPQFIVDVAYRLEYDDNLTFPDEEFGSGKEDYRHVLMADLLYRRPLGGGWLLYGQAHARQSLHNDYGEFDRTRLSGTAGIGWQGERWGWRLPLEVDHDRLDGDSFRTSVATLPGLSLELFGGYLGYLYGRLQSDDYEEPVFPEEDRSGDVTGAGVMLAGHVTPRLQLRSYVELNRYDTDGAYWERDETVAFIYGEFEFTSNWTAGLAFRYVDRDFENARPVFADRQQDETRELYLNLTHQFTRDWRVRGQISLIDQASNIPIFDYDRNVYSISIVRGF